MRGEVRTRRPKRLSYSEVSGGRAGLLRRDGGADDGSRYRGGGMAVTPGPSLPFPNAPQPSAVRHVARRPPRMSARQIWGLVRASIAALGKDYTSSMGAALSFY